MSNILKNPKTKVCPKCQKTKSVDDFDYKRKGSLLRNSYCIDCVKLKSFEYTIKRNHNLSIEEYNQLLINQNYSCAICLRRGIKLVIDHCHKTNKVRGLLCDRCNMLLGQFNDDTESFKRIIHYLEQ